MQKPVLVSVPVVSTVPPKVVWSFELYLYLELTVPQVSDCCPLGRLVCFAPLRLRFPCPLYRVGSNDTTTFLCKYLRKRINHWRLHPNPWVHRSSGKLGKALFPTWTVDPLIGMFTVSNEHQRWILFVPGLIPLWHGSFSGVDMLQGIRLPSKVGGFLLVLRLLLLCMASMPSSMPPEFLKSFLCNCSYKKKYVKVFSN